MVDWNIDEKVVEYKGGKVLVKNFIKNLKQQVCLYEWLHEYNKLLTIFREISETRNNIVKALYGHNTDTSEIVLIDQVVGNKMSQIMRDNNHDFEDFSKKYMRPVDDNELRNLLSALEDTANALQKLRSKILIEKFELFSKIFIDQNITPFPEDAMKNPQKHLCLLTC